MRPFDDEAPSCPQFTEYDRTHTPLYIRLLDADAAGVSWEKIAEHVFKLDVRGDPTGARRTVETHVARAKWMMDRGYKDLLRSPPKR
jgi:hypothetical protein